MFCGGRKIILLFFLLLSGLSAKENEQTGQAFELFVKRQTYTFTPYEYTSSTRVPEKDTIIINDGLRQNSKVLVPMTLRFEDLQKKYWLEIAYYEIEIINSNSAELTTRPGATALTRKYFPAVTRSEAEINLFKIFQPYNSLKLGFGGGGKNINKYIYGNNIPQGAFQVYHLTYGPQLGMRLDWNFSGHFSLAAMLDAFYTQGSRYSDNVILQQNRLEYSVMTAGRQGIYRGMEVDLAFFYRFLEKYRIGVGYNTIGSWFSPLHNDTYLFTLTSTPNQNPDIKIRPDIQNGNFEKLQGVYTVLSVSF